MAQMSSRLGRPSAISDVNYDLVTTLAEDLEAIDVLNTYVEDAQKAGDADAERIFNQIREDELRHCDMLKRVIEDRCRQGKFE